MRTILAVLLLAGCTHAVTLLPRSGGEKAYGEYNDGSRGMTVTIRGETYTGSYVVGSGVGMTLSRGTVAPGIGVSNQRSALLTGRRGNVRCDFALSGFGGNGVCMDPDNNIWDLIVGKE